MDMSDKRKLLSELPQTLSIELSNIMYSQELKGVNYFNLKKPKFVASVAPLLKPVKVCKGEYIFIKGDALDGVYFIKSGEAAYVERRPQADLVFHREGPGSHFGDVDYAASSQDNESVRLFTLKAMSDMDLLFLEKEELFNIDIEFKEEVLALFTDSH